MWFKKEGLMTLQIPKYVETCRNLVEIGHCSIWWNTVISQFGGTQSICNSVEHGHFSILVDHSHFSIGWLGLTLVVDLILRKPQKKWPLGVDHRV